MRKITKLFLVAALGVAVCGSTAAQQPGADKPLKSNLVYPLTASEGPYLIFMKTFKGNDDALGRANDLASELRSQFRLAAYVYEVEDLGAKVTKAQLREAQVRDIGADTFKDEDGKVFKQILRTVRSNTEFAVFVGNFRTMEEARVKLEDIKKLPTPRCLNPTVGIYSDSKGGRADKPNKALADEGVFRTAFVSKNPFDGFKNIDAYTQRKSQERDKEIGYETQLNGNEQFSVLKCPKRYTLLVARFDPPAVLDGSKESVFDNVRPASYAKQGSRLEWAADKSRRLAELLRDGGKGYDAYVYHTMQSSYVTIGAFDSEKDVNIESARRALQGLQLTKEFRLLEYADLQPIPVPGK